MLITNLAVEEFSVERLLVEYKQPTSIEQMFRSLKDSLFVHAFFLHQAERVEALGYVLLMARQVFATGERRVRAAGRPLQPPSRGQRKKPTGQQILNHLQGAIVIRVGPGQGKSTCNPASGGRSWRFLPWQDSTRACTPVCLPAQQHEESSGLLAPTCGRRGEAAGGPDRRTGMTRAVPWAAKRQRMAAGAERR